MNKTLRYVHLSLELHVVSACWLGSHALSMFYLYFAHLSYKLERPALKIHILWCKTDICSRKLSAKVYLMLENSFPVATLCKLNNINVFFNQISTQHVLLKKFTIFLKFKFLKKLRYDVIFFWSQNDLSKNVERVYDAEHTTSKSKWKEKKRKQSMDRKVSSQAGFS